MNTSYIIYLGSYLVVAFASACMMKRLYPLTWTDSLITANGFLSGIVLILCAIAFSGRFHLPLTLSPGALISVLIAVANQASQRVTKRLSRRPEPEESRKQA